MPVGDGRLVCEHLENVARDLLQDYPGIVRSLARGGRGIYALYRGDRLYYLGLAANLRQRLSQHLRGRLRGSWDRFSVYLTVDDRHLHEMEALSLRISKPRGHRARPRLRRSENLGPELRRRIAEPPARRAEPGARAATAGQRNPEQLGGKAMECNTRRWPIAGAGLLCSGGGKRSDPWRWGS